eukprot:CAMPEP_0114557236 /NCGR_PEP_ID=MMETSP0114-20121206/9722_1 /TAXON_ID=31324 /ORGANISM="Goniomonas sp, Strain m" /LENGTH=493 /DNA_ID=CAMNT_0001742509 /DNA_START=157 /DNA_END=1635 /DNA_ORIENTATION=+
MKVVLVGPPGVGKTCLWNRYLHSKFSREYFQSSHVSIGSKICQRDQQSLRLEVWDVPGVRVVGVLDKYVEDLHAAILVCDVADLTSINEIPHWVQELRRLMRVHSLRAVSSSLRVPPHIAAPENVWIPIVLAVNKCDLQISRILPEVEMAQRAYQLGLQGCVHVAAQNNLEVRTLFRRVTELMFRKKSGSGGQQLHEDAANGDINVISSLLEDGVWTEARDFDYRTALHVAALHGHSVVVAQLLEAGASPFAIDMDGATPLHLAACCHSGTAAVAALCKAMRSAPETQGAVRTDTGMTPLHYSAAVGALGPTEALLAEAGLGPGGAGGCVSDVSDGGWTPLHSAVRGADGVGPPLATDGAWSSVDGVGPPLATDGAGSAVEGEGPSGQTPVGAARSPPVVGPGVMGDRAGVVAALLRAKADPLVKDDNGVSAMASGRGSDDACIRALFDDPLAKCDNVSTTRGPSGSSAEDHSNGDGPATPVVRDGATSDGSA